MTLDKYFLRHRSNVLKAGPRTEAFLWGVQLQTTLVSKQIVFKIQEHKWVFLLYAYGSLFVNTQIVHIENIWVRFRNIFHIVTYILILCGSVYSLHMLRVSAHGCSPNQIKQDPAETMRIRMNQVIGNRIVESGLITTWWRHQMETFSA